MSWMNLAITDPEHAIKWSVRWRQFLGFKQDHAFEDTGTFLGLTPRYVRGIVRDELRVGNDRWQSLRRRWWADCDRQAAELIAAAAEIKLAKEADQAAYAQYELPLGMANNVQTYSRTNTAVAVEVGHRRSRLQHCHAA